jgi:DNA-directed RNA polymerase specialized sigma24 family protein
LKPLFGFLRTFIGEGEFWMFRRKASQRAHERATEYATCKDFRRIFTEDMSGLHLLAYLLTADMAKAEQCFVAGLDDSIRGNQVFKQWARAWSKRAIIQNAVKLMSPVVGQREAVEEKAAQARQNGTAPENPLVSLVMQWTPFERFVFVMSVLEGYSVRECSALLACRDQDVIAAKSQVLQRLANETAQSESAYKFGGSPWNGLFAGAQVA